MSQKMRRVVLLLFVVLPSLLFADVLKITVDDAIHPITEEFIGRAVQQAQSTHADALLIELRTPGGLETSMRKIVEEITASQVPVIIYVTPSGARAASAGFVILEAADIAAMAPGTNTGAAHPVTVGGGQIDEVMKQKITNDAAALMRSIAEKRGRNVPVAESAVRESKSFTEKEALQQKLIDIISPNEQDLLKQLNGREITRWDGTKTKLKTDGPVREYTMTLKQQILAWLMNPNMSFVLLAIGLLALYVEFNHPGAIVPGVVGFFFIVLAVFALNILPIRYSAFAMILLAFVFFALEAKFTSHGALTIAGIVSLTVGALLLVDAPIPEMRVHLWTALAVSVPLGVITAFLMSLALKARRNKRASGVEAMIGEIAVAETALSPDGKVFVHGETWNARSSSDIAPGQKVRVKRVEGLWLEVEPVGTAVKATALTDAGTRV
ncbi:MAG TPA: nodulation protein NfeD [Terriglobales bacterium]|nr:nodulation protein NfeD [Terriglobales bacterium]